MEIVKCPHCEKFINTLNIVKLDAERRQPGASGTEKIRCAVFACPLCSKAIAVQEDPVMARQGIVAALTSLLRAR